MKLGSFIPPVVLFALRVPSEFNTPNLMSWLPAVKPVRTKVQETLSLSPTLRLTGDPELVKKPQKPSELVVLVRSKVTDPTASVRTVLVRPLKRRIELFARSWFWLLPSA